MFGWYSRPVEPGNPKNKETIRVRLLANPEDREAYEAKGYTFLELDVEPVPVPLEERIATLEASLAPSKKAATPRAEPVKDEPEKVGSEK